MFKDFNKVYSYQEFKRILDKNNIFEIKDIKDLKYIRPEYNGSIGYHIVTEELLNRISEVIKSLKVNKVVEVLAGTGYFGNHLRKRLKDVDLKLYDNQSWDSSNDNWEFPEGVISQNCLELDYSKVDLVIMAWPNYATPLGDDILNKMHSGQYLLYCGESIGGCCADDNFFDNIYENFEEHEDISRSINRYNLNFDGIHSYWTLYRKR